jgi:hypothetical protein
MRDHGLVKTQVSCQLLNYKKEMFGFQQLAIILTASSILELEQMIHDVMSMTTPEFVTRRPLYGYAVQGTQFMALISTISLVL